MNFFEMLIVGSCLEVQDKLNTQNVYRPEEDTIDSRVAGVSTEYMFELTDRVITEAGFIPDDFVTPVVSSVNLSEAPARVPTRMMSWNPLTERWDRA